MKYLGDETRPVAAVAVIFFFGLFSGIQSFAADFTSEINPAILFEKLTTLNPQYDTNLNELASFAESAGKKAKKESKAEKKATHSDDLKNLPTPELRKRFGDDSAKHEVRAFSTIGRLAKEALHANDASTRTARIADIFEVQAGLRDSRHLPVPEKLGLFTSWLYLFKNLSSAIGRGDTVATNLAGTVPPGGEQGRLDPQPSTFWMRPPPIAQQDLYAGFGRAQRTNLEDSLCDYSAPKTSSGTHAGFEVEYGDQRFKIKFGDLNSEPFTARIFYALGYHVDPTDFAPAVKVRYDRRLLREFHLRKPLSMQVVPLGIHLWTIQLQTHFDPFAFITTAVFKDGRKVSGESLKRMLFINPRVAHPEDSPGNFRTDVEASLDYLVMTAANVQPREGPTQSIGSWEFGELGHKNRRELRGAGLLAAWLTWFDSRGDNTKLRLERDASDVQLLHFFSDLGGGMGSGYGLFSPQGENPNDLTWTFTAPEIFRGPGRMTTPFRIQHFKPIAPTPAFAAMTMDDARWMARLIGQLTENQLRGALIASGYDNAAARLYLDKLISRRDRMIHDLGLEPEMPLLRPNGQNHEFSYDPAIDGPFETIWGGTNKSARASSSIVSHGKLLQR